MTRTELNSFAAILKARHMELTRRLGKREDIAVERAADALDELQSAMARELTTRNLERESALLRHVHDALARISDGTYGACIDCEEEISRKRLNAMPWALLCIHCQEVSDGNRQFGPPARLMKAA